MTVYVYGASDDLIEIDGDLSEEFSYTPRTYSHHDPKPYYLGFSDGTLLKVTYDGDWNIQPIYPSGLNVFVKPHGATYVDFVLDIPEYIQHNVPDYSDLVVIRGKILWAIGGTDVVK